MALLRRLPLAVWTRLDVEGVAGLTRYDRAE
jgi:hypothetical protein